MPDANWWNYKHERWDHLDVPGTDEAAKEYIPQSAPAQNLYNLLREDGVPILKAMRHVLMIGAGKNNVEATSP